jgi:hypothetical protein
MVRDPQSGKYRRARLFVMTLGYSRKSVPLLVWRSALASRPNYMSRPSGGWVVQSGW